MTQLDSCVSLDELSKTHPAEYRAMSCSLAVSLSRVHFQEAILHHSEIPQLHRLAGLLLGLSLLSTATAIAQQRHALPTNLAAPANAQPLAALPEQQVVRFGLTLPLRNAAALQTLIREEQDPASPHYHQYLSRQQFVEQFGPTQADYESVLSFAKAQGFTVTRTFANRLLVNVSGTPKQINGAFAVKMQTYKQGAEAFQQPGARVAAATSHSFYAPDVEPTIAGSVPILSVVGLSTRELPQPMLVKASTIHADTTGSGPDGQFIGSDMRAAYAPGVAATGSGQSVGLIELGPYNLSDVQAYFKLVGQPLNVPIYPVLLDVDGVCSAGCDDGEEVIDIEQAISMAPGLSGAIVYTAYGSGSDALTAFSQAASDDVAKQLSLSFGFGGTPATMQGYEQVFMELAAQGQNTFIASGDSGANVGGVGYPGNSPNVTDVGGTDLTTAGPGGTWQGETAWIGSGGGWNTQSPIPAYQVPAINTANQGSPSYRNIPDVAMEANTDNLFCANGSCQEGIGGTSLAAPRWAAFLALANETANGNPVGFVNPTFYALGRTKSYTTDFHDITVGDNFNSSSPNLFSATTGYDLTSGWGSPTGQSMLNALSPANVSTAPNFSVAASPVTLNLKPGGSATTTVALTPTNGFTGAVDLVATVIGAPAGVTATLGTSTLSGAGQTTLTVDTTAATPGGNYAITVTGSSGGLQHTAYVQLALPDFTISATPSALYLDQQASTTSTIAIDPINGFSSPVALALTGTPPLVNAKLSPATTSTTSKLTLSAAVTAPASTGSPLTLTGTSGGTTHYAPALTVAISAALGDCGLGTQVDLSKAYNLVAVRADGTTFTDGGLDGDGYAYSGTLLSTARVLNGVRFHLGTQNVDDAVYGAGQTIALPEGRYTNLQLLATGIEGDQAGQIITVTYTDGTTAKLTLGFSDWFNPTINVDEGAAVAMPYRNSATGTPDNRQFNLYSYSLLLDSRKTVKSFTLPENRDIVILAATLSDLSLGVETNLAKAYNATGIYTDGSTFPADGGLDGGGAAYSANLLNDTAATGEDIVVGPSKFHLAAANVPNVVYGAGQTIALPSGIFTELKLLGTGVQGDETDQPLIIHYTDGTSEKISQSFSDWSTLDGYANESLAVKTAYRDYNDGSQDAQAFNVYLYTYRLNPFKRVKSITLPVNRNVVILSITLAPPSVVDLEPLVCRIVEQPHR